MALHLIKGAESELVVRKSRFISAIVACENADELRALKETVRQKNKGARHVVHAAVFANPSLFSYGDDGEPKGTAGIPTYEILKSAGVCGAAILTVRYFGGILLGTGGLRRAYSDSARLCVGKAVFGQVENAVVIRFTAGYGDVDKLKRLFDAVGARLLGMSSGESVEMEVEIKSSESGEVKRRIEEILRKRI